jgi:hypothetical protein
MVTGGKRVKVHSREFSERVGKEWRRGFVSEAARLYKTTRNTLRQMNLTATLRPFQAQAPKYIPQKEPKRYG